MAVLEAEIGEESAGARRPAAADALAALDAAATLLQEADLDGLDAREELEVVWSLVEESHRYAMGEPQKFKLEPRPKGSS